MPPKTADPARQQTRSRTGCQTCRKRKLKCDEVRPICTPCTKSNRECVPSEGVAWRHQQNAGADESDRVSLPKFFNKEKDAAKFNQEQIRAFLPIPDLTWLPVNSGFETTTSTPSTREASPVATQAQQVAAAAAADSLAVLSTAAEMTYTPQPPQHAYYSTNAPSTAHPEYNFVQAPDMSTGMGGANMPFILHHPQQPHPQVAMNPMIDPQLQASVAQVLDDTSDVGGGEEIDVAVPEDGEHNLTVTDAEAENHIGILALREFNNETSA
ncbi:hypothetical protein LTR84_011043 [Exophiala bonariae]|uniref:Zn(2)-C6 fungal-type domain-containing protein n=1 Tax=Exophiala bonariae TaxID=1690606 RepID=A0AAV9NIJ3_9EURO|nr:hypothetical protein LTR84_011043 [Exophiala bonariae]